MKTIIKKTKVREGGIAKELNIGKKKRKKNTGVWLRKLKERRKKAAI